MIYDTLSPSKALQVSFTPEQSETLARALSQSTDDSVATKLDIAALKTDIAALRDGAALKTDIANLKVEMVRWIVGVIAFNLLGTIGIMVTVAELVLKAK